MNLLYLYNEYTNYGNSYLLVSFLFILSLLFAILVIISKNPIVSVLFLIGLFSTVALYLMVSNIKFIGLSYLLVYVGAISILFLFILMLINVRISELVTDNNNSIPLSLMVLTIFGITFQDKGNIFNTFNYMDNNNVSYALSSSWDNALFEMSHISNIGNILYTSHPMLLFATSLILLLSMIGSIIITLKQDS